MISSQAGPPEKPLITSCMTRLSAFWASVLPMVNSTFLTALLWGLWLCLAPGHLKLSVIMFVLLSLIVSFKFQSWFLCVLPWKAAKKSRISCLSILQSPWQSALAQGDWFYSELPVLRLYVIPLKIHCLVISLTVFSHSLSFHVVILWTGWAV